jgi:hypothetical protein
MSRLDVDRASPSEVVAEMNHRCAVFPELVTTLKRIEATLSRLRGCGKIPREAARQEMMRAARDTLAKARRTEE